MTDLTRLGVHPIVKQVIDRDCHVAESNRTVIRHVISKLRGGWQTFSSLSKSDRRQLMQQCVQQHRDNRELYRAVMFPNYQSGEED